jgi:hypothetical protein
MTKYGNIVAASILGISLIIAAVIVNSGLHEASVQISNGIRFPPSPSFPSEITLRNGNSRFGVQVEPLQFSQQPIKVEVQTEKK